MNLPTGEANRERSEPSAGTGFMFWRCKSCSVVLGGSPSEVIGDSDAFGHHRNVCPVCQCCDTIEPLRQPFKTPVPANEIADSREASPEGKA